MVVQQMTEVNLEWRDGFYTDDLDMSEVKKMEAEETDEQRKEDEKKQEEDRKKEAKQQDTVVKPKRPKKNKVAKLKKPEAAQPTSSPELTAVQIPMVISSIACLFDPNMYFFLIPFCALPNDWGTPIKVIIFCMFISSNCLENQYHVLRVAERAENMGLFWYLYVETFKDYLSFMKAFYLLVKLLIGLFNFSMAKDLRRNHIILALITL